MEVNLNIEIPEESANYLEASARLRNISKTRLIRRAFLVILSDQLFLSILDDECPKRNNRRRKVLTPLQYDMTE